MGELRLFLGKRNTGISVAPDPVWSAMWRIHKDGETSDMVNLARAKDAALSLVRPKGLKEWEAPDWLPGANTRGTGACREKQKSACGARE